MPRETDAADFLADEGSPEADRHLAENFGMTVRQVRDFDPQTLDATRACKFLGLPPKRFDQLAAQPEARGRWVESVARQKKDLIETFPQAGAELKGMLEAIRKFALRKCLKPDGPALVDGGGSRAKESESRLESERRQKFRMRLVFGGIALAVLVLVGGIAAVSMSSKRGPDQQAKSPADDDAKQVPVTPKTEPSVAPTKPAVAPDPIANPPVVLPASPSDRFQVKSVWTADNPPRQLTVTEREGEKFTAVFKVGEKIERVITGTIKSGKIGWLTKDVRAIRGGIGGDNQGTLGSDKDGDKIDFAWKDSTGANGTFILRMASPQPRSFRVGSVWKGDQRVLTVTECKDHKFTATFKIGTKFERIVTGSIEDGKIHWLGKDVSVISGDTKGGNYDGTFGSDKDGDTIEFAWRDGKGETGSFLLRPSKEPFVQPVPAPPRLEDLDGAWNSNFGKVTLEANKSGVVFGYWIQAINKKGFITGGTFTPGTRTLTFSIAQPWNNEKGSATFTLSADGTKLDGTWKHSSGNGKWQMTRVAR